MAFKTKPPKSNGETLAEGSYGARLLAIGDMGTQSSDLYGDAHKVFLQFVVDAYRIDGRPYTPTMDCTFTLYGDRAKLPPIVEALLGRRLTDNEKDGSTDFDFDQLLGKPCMVSIKHSKSGFANIATVTRPPKGVSLPPRKQADEYSWGLDEDSFDPQAMAKAPPWIRSKIEAAPEFLELTGQAPKKAAPAKKKPKSLDDFAGQRPTVSEELDDDFPEALGGKPEAKALESLD